MTWLKGTTTWQNCVSDLTALIAGERTDGVGTTCSTPWIREIGGQDLLRSPSSADVTLPNMSNRSGYFALFTSFSTRSVCKATNIFTSNPATSQGRWAVMIGVQGANTVASDYSTARLMWSLMDADTGVQVSSGSSVAPSSGGTVTITNGLIVNVSDPSGFLAQSVCWIRTFTTTYVGGIDYWGPYYSRRSGSATFSVNPSGTSVTDWDVIDIPVAKDTMVPTTLSNFFGSTLTSFAYCSGGWGRGLGIKTNTGLSGALYTCTWPCAFQKIRMVLGSGTVNNPTAGVIGLEVGGGGGLDATSTYRATAGFYQPAWLRCYQTPASVTNGSAIQYWASVTPKKIVIVLNADPGQSGRLGSAWVGAYTVVSPLSSLIKFPCVWNQAAADFTADTTSMTFNALQQTTLFSTSLRSNGSENRDWQTGWMRSDVSHVLFSGGLSYVDQGYSLAIGQGALAAYFTAPTASTAELAPNRQTKPSAIDGNWWLYGFTWSDGSGSASAGNVQGDGVQPKGTSPGVYYIPSDGWNSGDELTDTGASKTYFLIAADYPGVGTRMRSTTNTYWGGAAILEE